MIILNLILINLISAIRINEVELNPYGSSDSGKEWLELYSEDYVNIVNWKISSSNGRNMSFNASFSGYYLLNTSYQLLTDNNNKLSLYNGLELIYETDILNDNKNDDGTWQYCNGNWNFTYMTRNSQNNCSAPANPPQNNTQNQEDSISLDMDWNEDEIINGDEFEIEISAENLEDEKYNVKVWIEFEDENTVISDRYGEDSSGEEAWKSGSYYVYNLLNGPGDETEKVNLRIRDNYNDFKGDAKIFFKLSTGEEVSKDIEILEKEEDKVAEKKEVIKQNNTQEIKTTTKSTAPVSGNVIKLGSSESKETIDNTGKNTANSNLIYESKNEKIKIYAIIGFAALCLGLVILMIFKKIK